MAKDFIHDAVKNALVKDGWIITHDPLTIKYGDLPVFVDLGAERVIAAQRNQKKIAVEIKSFIGRSVMRDMERALGQYVVYSSFLESVEPDRKLYLAINHQVYQTTFAHKAFKYLIKRNTVSMLIVNVKQEEVVEWIK